LLDNAVKYSGESREISVRAWRENQRVIISVKDHGIGMSKEDMKKIFDKFYRATGAQTRPVAGTGLGLTLVKQIIEAHKGEITVQSEAGKGSLFTVRLPITEIER